MLAHRPTNTIHLGGDFEKLNEWVAGVEIRPGMELEFYNDSGKMKLRPSTSATGMSSPIIAQEKTLHNKTITDVYKVGELILAYQYKKGGTYNGIIPSGQNITSGDPLQLNGDGKYKEATSTTAASNVFRYQAIQTIGAVTEDTFCKIQVL